MVVLVKLNPWSSDFLCALSLELVGRRSVDHGSSFELLPFVPFGGSRCIESALDLRRSPVVRDQLFSHVPSSCSLLSIFRLAPNLCVHSRILASQRSHVLVVLLHVADIVVGTCSWRPGLSMTTSLLPKLPAISCAFALVLASPLRSLLQILHGLEESVPHVGLDHLGFGVHDATLPPMGSPWPVILHVVLLPVIIHVVLLPVILHVVLLPVAHHRLHHPRTRHARRAPARRWSQNRLWLSSWVFPLHRPHAHLGIVARGRGNPAGSRLPPAMPMRFPNDSDTCARGSRRRWPAECATLTLRLESPGANTRQPCFPIQTPGLVRTSFYLLLSVHNQVSVMVLLRDGAAVPQHCLHVSAAAVLLD